MGNGIYIRFAVQLHPLLFFLSIILMWQYITEAESLGYRKPKGQPKRQPKVFRSKSEKWAFMKENELDGIYLICKEIFGDIGEPEVFLKADAALQQQN